MKILALCFTFICIISVNSFAAIISDGDGNNKPKDPASVEGLRCTVTRSATGSTSIECRGEIITRGPYTQSCTVTVTSCGDALVQAQNCANAALGNLLAAVRAQLTEECKDQP
jgi:hypothetical protein